MGLDVYLYRFKDKKAEEAVAKSFEKWKKAQKFDWKGSSQAEAKAQHEKEEKEALRLGLGKYGDAGEKIELKSKLHPDHLFEIGYFRSSYNESGFDRILESQVGLSLSDLFGAGNEYEFQPNWKNALSLSKKALRRFKDKLKEDGAYRAIKVDHNMFTDPATLEAKDTGLALEVFRKEREKHTDSDFGSYSNINGIFFMKEPLEVVALIAGTAYDKPCHYAIYEDAEGLKWYVEALEVVVESIEWVLSQPKPEQFWLHWSG